MIAVLVYVVTEETVYEGVLVKEEERYIVVSHGGDNDSSMHKGERVDRAWP